MSEMVAQLSYVPWKYEVRFTNLIQHFVTFVKNEDLNASETKLFVTDQRV